MTARELAVSAGVPVMPATPPLPQDDHVMVGQEVARGGVLVTIEAMKMETSVRADRDGKVVEVVASLANTSMRRTCWS